MNRRTILSLAIILLAVASVGGATMAWFTDEATVSNTFSAGTFEITAVDGWQGLGTDDWVNVNPGDCNKKDFTITNLGSKHALIRLKWDGEWNFTEGDASIVTVTAPVGWFLHDGYYYYTTGPLTPVGTTDAEINFELEVCTDGESMDNDYQDKSFTISFTVEAIQASNNASGSVGGWGVDSVYSNPEEKTALNWTNFDFQ